MERGKADADRFYARIMELASLDSRSQANKVVGSVMRGLLGRLPRISAGLIADALPQPIPGLVLGSPPFLPARKVIGYLDWQRDG